jgi:hypothetical protein
VIVDAIQFRFRLFQQPVLVVAIEVRPDGGADLLDVLQDASENDLLLELSMKRSATRWFRPSHQAQVAAGDPGRDLDRTASDAAAFRFRDGTQYYRFRHGTGFPRASGHAA